MGNSTDFEALTVQVSGLPLEKVLTLYKRAVENDWQTVQSTTKEAVTKLATNHHEAEELFKLTRAILTNENGDTLITAGLAEPKA